MPFPVLGSNSAVAAGYEIDNSLRIGSGRKLSRTFTAVTAERKKHTMSCWIKLCILDGEIHMIISIAGSNNTYIRVNDDHKIRFRLFDNSQDKSFIATSRLFRDVSAWQHIMLVYDSAQSTASNRVKIYVNGEQQTSFSTETYPDQNVESIIGNNAVHSIEGYSDGGEFYVADWYYIGNQALSPSDFGETNDNGVWVPKKYTGTFGSTNDTFLEFKQTGTGTDASGIGADTSGQNNHMASTNLAATDVTTDTPTNNFSTMNPLANFYAEHTFSEGNCKIVTQNATGHYTYATSTMGVANGKWYAEFKASAKSGGGDWFTVGVAEAMGTASNLTLGRDTGHTSSANNGQIGYLGYSTNFVYQNDTYYATSYSTDAYGVGDIIGVALNADDNEVTFYKNGTAQNSGTAFTIGASPTGFWHFAVGDFENQNYTWECNFGNPSNSISSGNSDANGYGNFEYAPPTNYYSLCSKNLAEYG